MASPQLENARLDSQLACYFLTHASFALVAGASLDGYGAKWTIRVGIACIAAGTTMFDRALFFTRKSAGLQGVGSATRKTPAIIIGAPLNA